MKTYQFEYSVQLAGAKREEYIAGFKNFTEAVNYADAIARRIHEDGSTQTVNVWNERTDMRVHVVYPPMAEAA